MLHRQSVRAIVLNGDKMLVMRRYKSDRLYYTLVGGGVEAGESQETALRRELREETGLSVGMIRLVFIEDGGAAYGPQYVYLCEYEGGAPSLDPSSYEAHLNAEGQNTYQPLWLSVGDLPQIPFRSIALGKALLEGLQNGFPKTPVNLPGSMNL